MIGLFQTALAAVILFLTTPMMQANPSPDPDGHVLTALWQQYEQAVKADRPQTEAEILSKIKTEAQAQHLPVDFYDAATQYVETVRRRDWKQYDQLRTNLRQEVESFGDPMVTYLWMGAYGGQSSDARWAYVKVRSDAFRAGHNQARTVVIIDGGKLLRV